MKTIVYLLSSALALLSVRVQAQPRLETGSQKPMPAEWIDKDTGHKLVRLTQLEGNNESFYFHNNPFVKQRAGEGDKMVFYNTTPTGKRLYALNLRTLQAEPLSSESGRASGEIVAPKRREVIYQRQDSVFATHVDTKKTRLVYVFPADFKASISTLNADETVLAGSRGGEAAREILRKYPEKKDFFPRIFEAKVPHELFTINTQTGELKKIHQENTWLGHVQFSPTDPDLLMFCHEGPWHLVDRIWHISLKSGAVKLMHKRSMDGEIAGHEFFSRDGKTIWFDLQKPRGETFYLAGSDVATGKETVYEMTRDEWSIHFNISPDQKLFAGDGGDPGQVAKARDGMWLYLFRPEGDTLKSERLVNMKHHGYKLEPNVHFSPDGKWIIFRANFEGKSQVYAVEIAKANS
ncbi:oligogalacturonate lyase family protein [Spirosoma soli]|uniref:Oligogalacturonate lyase family protein n=1 Tax=Spirosoma soli TaxID=1770529 RepID=A0ABW5LW73_9BACT